MRHAKSSRRRAGALMARALAGVCAVTLLAAACSSEEIIVKTASGVELKAEDIDAEPLALVPPGSIAILNLQPKELFQSPLGHHFLNLARAQFPIPASARFEAERDLDRLIVAVYSSAGVDFSGVALGAFDAEALQAAAQRSDSTPLGTPLVAVRYSQWEFFVSGNIGFCVLTPRTVLFGNEVGIRRALDRLERGDLAVQMDSEVESLIRNPGAPIALGASNADSSLDAVVQRTPLANNLRMVRLVANLQAPGMNVAGTFTFGDEASARAAKSGVDQVFGAIQGVDVVGALFGMKPTNLTYQAQLVETSVQVTAATETQVAERLLAGLNELLPRRQSSAP